MFERFHTPAEAYEFKLGATLKMEQKVLDILESNIEAAQDTKVKDLLRTHHGESQDHVRNVEEVFGLFGWEIEDSSCPAIEGLEKEGAAMVKKTDDSLVDSVILQGAVEVEHHEIGVYENLIINAEAMDRQDVVAVLRRNIESEQGALEKVKTLQAEVAAVTPKATAV
jgi:ferritin-like metal-binding protein YciE